jgi:uncharacterized membrane protein
MNKQVERPKKGQLIRIILRWLLAVFYLLAGVIHLINPAPFTAITPDLVPFKYEVVILTGVAEIIGAIGLMQIWSMPLRRLAGLGLALYALCVFPANINHMFMDMARVEPVLGWGYHAPRMVAQPVLIWLALWVSSVIHWPFQRP